MLARLEEDPGVSEAHVDVTGRYFLLALNAGTNGAVSERLAALVGDGALRLGAARALAQFDGGAGGEAWFSSATIRQLSRIEARVLSQNWGAAAGRAAGLSVPRTLDLVEALRNALDDVFDETHGHCGEQDSSWYKAAFRPAFESALTSAGLSTDEQQRARDKLLAFLG